MKRTLAGLLAVMALISAVNSVAVDGDNNDAAEDARDGNNNNIHQHHRIRGDILLLHMGRCGSTLLMRSLWSAGHHSLIGFPKLSSPQAPELGKQLRAWKGRTTPAAPYDPEYKASDEELAWHAERLRRFRVESHALVPASEFILESVKMGQIMTTGLSVTDFLTVARAAGFRHLIILHRSYLRSALSFALVERIRGGEWHIWTPGTDGRRNCAPLDLSVDMQRYYAMHTMYRQAALHPAWKARRSSIIISYEQDVYQDVAQACESIFRWIGLGYNRPSTLPDLSKTADCSLRELLINYGEHERILGGTSLAWMLEPEGQQRQSKGVKQLLGLSPSPPSIPQ